MSSILGLRTLDSPYKIIAADVNNDRKVTAQDAITRRLILNIDTKFPNNTGWRFIDASYQFPEPGQPVEKRTSEVINIRRLKVHWLTLTS
ncbi:MAG: hypothetical protein R2824_18040 [Saprospiraceae bacterium]